MKADEVRVLARCWRHVWDARYECTRCGAPRNPAASRRGRTALRAGKDAAPKITEADFLRQVVELATILGWEYVHFRPAQTQRGWRTPVQGPLGKGFPDLVLVRPRDHRLIFAELKRDAAKTTPDQDRVLRVLRSLSTPVPAQIRVGVFEGQTWTQVLIWHPSDFDAITATLR
jgi:hypothetical protein